MILGEKLINHNSLNNTHITMLPKKPLHNPVKFIYEKYDLNTLRQLSLSQFDKANQLNH